MSDAFDYLAGTEILAKNPQVCPDNHGNISIRIGEDRMIIKPSGMSFKECLTIQPCCVNVEFKMVDGEMKIISEGTRKPSVDSLHHAWIYYTNPDIESIVHTHSPYAAAFALADKSIPCVSTEQADLFGGTIMCAPYSDLDNWGRMVGRTLAAPGNAHFKSLKRAVLLGSHGSLTFGNSGVQAAKRACLLEQVAQKTYMSLTLRPNLAELPPQEVAKWSHRYDTSYGQGK